MKPRPHITIELVLWLPTLSRAVVAAARSSFAIRAVYAARLVCYALIWLMFPDAIAELMNPRRQVMEICESCTARPMRLRR